MLAHMVHLEIVFWLLHQHKLYVNKKKSEFDQPQLAYLGHIVSADGVFVDPSKVQAIWEWPQPRTITDLRSFLRFTGYYKKFVQGYSHIAKPLIEQLKKGCYLWDEEAKLAFQRLKTAMTRVPVLATPNFSKPFVNEVDASGFSVGAVLMQEGKPVAFHNQVLGQQACQKSAYEKELMAIVLPVLKRRSYLLSRKFIVIIDQKSLKFLLQQREIEPEYHK